MHSKNNIVNFEDIGIVKANFVVFDDCFVIRSRGFWRNENSQNFDESESLFSIDWKFIDDLISIAFVSAEAYESVVEWIAHRPSDQQVSGSSPGLDIC